jgi:7-cyano-7-deazaguanine synthase
MSKTKKAIVLVSGGLDSLTCLAIANSQGYEIHALTFDYHQKHSAEINAAKACVAQFPVASHQIIKIPVDVLTNTALVNSEISVPDYSGNLEIPVTYVPARNTLFLVFALARAEILNAEAIFTGVSCVDYSHYPDCRPEYINAMQEVFNLAIKKAVEGSPIQLVTPLLYLSKAETIQLGLQLGIDYSLSVSCYRADEAGRACGSCDPCTFRKKGFVEAQVSDPTIYS